jgi:AraC-like DNA-binding protein
MVKETQTGNFASEKRERRHGFQGESLYVVPRNRLGQFRANPVLSGLLVTDAGHFPKAASHLRRRLTGCEENIFLLCTEGKGLISIPGRRFTLSAGEAAVLSKNTPHEYAADAADPWTIYWFHVVGDFTPVYLPAPLANRAVAVSPERIEQVVPVFLHIFQQLSSGNTEHNLINAGAGAAFILSQVFLNNEHDSDTYPSVGHRALEEVLVYIQDHLESPITLDDLGERSKLSISRLSQLFHQVTGYSPMQFVRHQRVQRACYYLESTDEPIGRIAELVGFDDQFYFSRLFRKITGVSPRGFRDRPKNSS